MSASPILVVKVGSALPALVARRGDFEDWFALGLGVATEVVDVAAGAPLPEAPSAILVTGSGAMVTDRADWSERCAGWLRRQVEQGVPTLGVCYGHQLLADAFGGTVENNPLGRQMGTTVVEALSAARTDRLFGGLPDPLCIMTTHVQSVTRLPDPDALEVVRLAVAARDANHAFRIGPSAWGVQFHPEMDAEVIRAYLDVRAVELEAEGFSPAALGAGLRDTDHGTQLLRRFAQIARGDA